MQTLKQGNSIECSAHQKQPHRTKRRADWVSGCLKSRRRSSSADDCVPVGLLDRNGLLSDDVRLVDGCLNDLLLVGIQVLGKILVQRGLFLLQSCTLELAKREMPRHCEAYSKALP